MTNEINRRRDKMLKKLSFTIGTGLLLLFSCTVLSFAATTSVDALIEKLTDKGVITKEEARGIKVDIVEDEKLLRDEGFKQGLPSWIRDTKLKGDFRLRYQYNHNKTVNNQTNERHRGRFRLRLGLESNVNEKLLVGIGLASGTDSTTASNKDRARSTNQSFDDSFAKKPINLDYAFAKYTALPWLTLIGGKMQLADVIWEPGDLIWDTDITPEGGVINLEKKVNPNINLFMKNAFLVLEEDSTSNDDPSGIHIQPGIDAKLTDNMSLKNALAFDYWAVGNTTLNNSANSNTGSTGNSANPRKDFVNMAPAFELKIKEPLKWTDIGFLDIPSLAFFGEYVRNLNNAKPDDNKSGFMAGLKFGAEKIANWRQWQASYNFARLEKDAVLDILPDSDRYEGQTNIRAHEAKFAYGLGKNTYLEFDVYRAQKLSKPKQPETVFQLDWNLKW